MKDGFVPSYPFFILPWDLFCPSWVQILFTYSIESESRSATLEKGITDISLTMKI
jgi:hypothetical protein